MNKLDRFEALFNKHFGDLVAYAFRFLENKEEAEDVVQEVFFSLWKKRESLVIQTSIESYLLSAVKHACLNKFRHNKVKIAYRKNIKYDNGEVKITPHNQLVHKELESLIESSLADLPERSLKIFTMNRYDRKKYREIADEMSISIKSVEAHMSRVLKHLRLKIGNYITIMLLLIIS